MSENAFEWFVVNRIANGESPEEDSREQTVNNS